MAEEAAEVTAPLAEARLTAVAQAESADLSRPLSKRTNENLSFVRFYFSMQRIYLIN